MTTSGGFAETHISTVLFTHDRAYKVLKPVDVGFADFTDTSERLAAVDRELALNRRLAPDVYLGTADVHEDGRLVDRILVMRRLADDHRLEGLLEVAGSDPQVAGPDPQVAGPDPQVAGPDPRVQECLDGVVRAVASLHMASEPVRDTAARMATRDSVQRNWEDNFAAIEPHVGTVIDGGDFDEARGLALGYLEGCAELFDERIRTGWIRDGHGDLRAEDIFCESDGPRILDCLAFSDELRVADVLADVGFLAMDLIHLGRPDSAGRLLARYGELTAETHPASLAHHYIAYRAHVRTKICCLQHGQGDTAKSELAASLHALALEQLRRGVPTMVIVGGGPGTGKSTVARGLSDREGLAYVGSDVLRKELAGLAATDSAAAATGEGIYTPEMSARVYAEMTRRAELLLSLGEHVVLDASFTSEAHRRMVRELAGRRRARLVELCCEVDRDVARRRVEARVGDPSDADTAVVDHLAARADPWPRANVLDTCDHVEVVLDRAASMVRRASPADTGGTS